MKKHFFLQAAVLAVLLGGLGARGADFSKTQVYSAGQFSDVAEAEWYAPSVASAYELGFMKGTNDTLFEPNGSMTVAEAVTIAARVHDAYHAKGTSFRQDGAHWYDDYVRYAIDNGILQADAFDDYERPVKRYEMAVIFSMAVPDDYLNAQNNVTEIPDVPNSNAYFDRLQLLYNAGVVMGNDEYGTFMPNNNIIRAEAAAIIGRIALKGNRLKKTLTDASYDQAWYLINDTESEFRTDDAGSVILSPWVIDKRFKNTGGSAGTGLSDFDPTAGASAKREFAPVERGLLGLDFIAKVQLGTDGLYFRVTDSNDTSLMSLDTKDGEFYFNGVKTGVAVADRTYHVNVRMDLDTHTALLYMDGKRIGESFTLPALSASRFYVGSDEKGMAYVFFDRCDLYKDYVVNERFLVPENAELAAWDVTGEAKVVRAGGENNNDPNSALLTEGAVAKKSFRRLSGKVVFETLLLFPTANDTGYIRLTDGGTPVASIKVNADGIFKADGTKLRHHTNNLWQTLRIEADTVSGTVLYKVNGKKVGEFSLDTASKTVDGIEIGCDGGSICFDDVTVTMAHEYDDYCPVPQPVGDDGFDTWVNICSLWHDGTSWGAVSSYPDIEPVLGYYDEGIPELSDWEIKFMVENGIDIQHICWYAPDNDQSEPIKKPSLNYWSLHEGFFNAKYSDMMKFNIMWENNSTVLSDFEHFKEYIWKYWVDYYFTDDRYYTIDNKVVFTVWSYPNFLKSFGDTTEGAKNAIDFMNEDIKKYGFDGVMVIFFDYHKGDAATFQTFKDMGAEGAYAYHWGQDGNNYEATIKRLENNASHKAVHIIPTVSVGFNNLGWSGSRKELISLSDHKKVLEYIKNDYLPDYEGWQAKNVIVSTWNEYGEGTYVMPCEGLHGFGYLENVAEVLSGVTDHSHNIVPTDAQKARLGHMNTKTSLKRWHLEEPTPIVSDEVLYTATGADLKGMMHLTEDSGAQGDIFKGVCETGDPALLIREDKLFAPIAAEKIAYVRLRMKVSTDSLCDVFFTTDASGSYDEAKSLRISVRPTNDFVDYLLPTSTCKDWKDNIKSLRIDPITGSGSFEVASVELLGQADSNNADLYIHEQKYTPVFPLEVRDGEVYAPTESESEFFARHRLYYEWDRHTGVLTLVSVNNKKVTFTVGSDKAVVNGKEVSLAEKVSLKDGLPVVPLCFLYDSLGMKYTFENNVLRVSPGKSAYEAEVEAKREEALSKRIPNQYEFELDGDNEGWTGSNTTITVVDGAICGTALLNEQKWYDPMIRLTETKLDASVFNCITLAIRYDSGRETDEKLQLFFLTDKDKTWDEKKCFTVAYEKPTSDGKFIEYTLDCTKLATWKDTITAIRIDPLTSSGTYAFDYIRFSENLTLKEQKEKELAEKLLRGFELLGGDAEDTANVAFFNESPIDILKDEESGSNVYRNMAVSGYNYSRQSVVWDTGRTYEVSVDFKLLSNQKGETDFTTQIMFNARYTDKDGKYDHAQKLGEQSPADGWKTYTFSFEIPTGVEWHENDEFSFYVNPGNGSGVNYLFDNVTVKVK